MSVLRICAAGDAGLLVEWPARIDPETSGRAIALADALRTRWGATIRDAVVGYCSLTVYFDPSVVDAGALESQLRDLAADVSPSAASNGPLIDVPVCYGGDLGPDLSDVARFAGISPDEVIALHSGATYRVYVIGFVPGFPYMATVDSRIAAPRRAVPRTRVPAGSVAIAAGQTGIYPTETPGGWHLIGRTRVKPYDGSRPEPFLFHPGDHVRFHPIERAEFERLP
jgi:KipI family sensor histidine kinase inhibitor